MKPKAKTKKNPPKSKPSSARSSAGDKIITRELLHTGDEAKRADLIVKSLCPESRAQIRGMFQANCVKIDDVVCDEAGTLVESGQKVTLSYDSRRKYPEKARPFRSRLFQIVFEDNYLIVVNKQAGFLTMPTEKEEDVTLVRAINDYLRLKGGRSSGAVLVHRLDRDTSGLLVLAKHAKLAQIMKEQFKERKPMREYIAIVRGVVDRSNGSFRTYLATDKNLNQYSTDKEDQGKLAITHFRVDTRFEDTTFVRVKLETGRRNQIRVHFSEYGHPIIGDVRYKPELAAHPDWHWKRLALHAETLGFTHPVTKKHLEFRAPQPMEFQIFLKKARNKIAFKRNSD